MRADGAGRTRAAALVAMAAALAACGGGGAGEPDGGAAGDARPGRADASGGGPADGGAAPLRLMTFNIKHGEVTSLEELADVILAEAPDIVALQEVDSDRARSGNVVQHERLGQLTGMASSFSHAIQYEGDGQYGLAILSRHPIRSSDKLFLTSTGEQRILAGLADRARRRPRRAGRQHPPGDRCRRSRGADRRGGRRAGRARARLRDGRLQRGARRDGLPDRHRRAPRRLGRRRRGDGFTIPADEPTARIDYVLLGADWPAATAAHVVDTQASDHRPVVVEVPLP